MPSPSTSSDARAHLLIEGRVQGVGYRAAACERAIELDLRGWVRNLPDGRVEAVVEGERDTVAELIEWCRRGPRFARVTGVAVTWETAQGGLSGFELRR